MHEEMTVCLKKNPEVICEKKSSIINNRKQNNARKDPR
jgi:hypothetical protein